MDNTLRYESKWNYRLVYIPIVLFMSVILVYSYYAKLDEVVRAQGKVIPSSQNQIIQHLEGGIVANIYVKEGEIVEKGDKLYLLSQEFFTSDKNSKEMELLASKVKEKRLLALSQDKSRLVLDQKELKEIPSIVSNEKHIFQNERNNYKKHLALLEDELQAKKLELIEKSSKLINVQVELNIADENVKIQENLVRKGAASRKEYLLELAKKQSLYTAVESLKNSIPITKEEIKQAKKKIETFRYEAHTTFLKELSDVRVNIKKLNQSSSASDDRESRKLIVSPVKGVINKLYFHTIGGIIKPGDKVAEITPLDDILIIEAKVKPKDRAQIYIDQNASVEITAYDYSKYGMLDGNVISISADSFVDNNGLVYYEVKIKTDKNSFGKNEIIRSGMVANINILTGKKSILEYVLKPIKDIKKNSLGEK